MNTYIVTGLCCRIIKAKDETGALAESFVEKDEVILSDKSLFTKEDLRNKLLSMGFKKLISTSMHEVYKAIK